jgi:hypothetical protein
MNRGMIANAIVYRKAVWGGRVCRAFGLTGLLGAMLVAASCGDVSRQGTGSSYLIINQLEAARGDEPNRFSGTLNSDVVTIVDDSPSIFNDFARARVRLGMKDATITTPSPANFITLNRYHVKYVRADGRNTPGVDVPYPFDGAVTATVSEAEAVVIFEVVRHIAKVEAPLGALARNLVIISTIAEITFYGTDQTGREVSVTGKMLIDFGNFADPGNS